jgi:hypothetical protein
VSVHPQRKVSVHPQRKVSVHPQRKVSVHPPHPARAGWGDWNQASRDQMIQPPWQTVLIDAH